MHADLKSALRGVRDYIEQNDGLTKAEALHVCDAIEEGDRNRDALTYAAAEMAIAFNGLINAANAYQEALLRARQ